MCWAEHSSNWLSARQAVNAWLEMFPQQFLPYCYPQIQENYF
jgi:hypothetical protein